MRWEIEHWEITPLPWQTTLLAEAIEHWLEMGAWEFCRGHKWQKYKGREICSICHMSRRDGV